MSKFLENMKLYLRNNSWKEFNTQYHGLSIFENPAFEGVELVLPKTFNSQSAFDIEATLNTLSIISEIEVDQLKLLIHRFEFDLHNFRFPGERIESVPLDIIEEILTSTRKLILLSAQDTYNTMREFFQKEKVNKTDITTSYVKHCNFAHTWKGSFGITIESPVNPKSIGLYAEPMPNFERKVTQKIYKGMEIIKQAQEVKSHSVIVDNVDVGFSGSMLKELLEIGEHSRYSENIEYTTNWAPAIPVEAEYQKLNRVELSSLTFSYLEKAVNELKPDEEEVYQISFIGFPEKLSSTKEQLLDQEFSGSKNVVIRGSSRIMKSIVSLKVPLRYSDYQKAAHAHIQKKDIRIQCKVKRVVRGWEVIDYSKVEIVN